MTTIPPALTAIDRARMRARFEIARQRRFLLDAPTLRAGAFHAARIAELEAELAQLENERTTQ